MDSPNNTDRVLAYVRQASAEVGIPPSIREIGAALGIRSTSVVNYHLGKLADRGDLRRVKGVARGLVLVDRPAV